MTDDLPAEVLTFGGDFGRTYHRIATHCDGLGAACGQDGRNPLRKTRALIESHYRPCSHCFPKAAREQQEVSEADV